MAKYFLILLTVLFSTSNLSAQECEYTSYYPLVNTATKNYSDKQYKKAEEKLKLAFTKTAYPQGRDLHLAIRVAKKRKNSEWAEQIAIKLAKGGVPLRYFGKLKSFEWYEQFNANFKNYSDHYAQHYNHELREELNSLLKRDKDFNNLYHQWRTQEIEMTLQELIDGASIILSDFNHLINKYGFPNEQLIGYNYVRRKNNVEHYPIGVLLVHIYQRGELILKDAIHEIVCKGGLHPEYEETLKGIKGFGDSTGIEQEMRARYKEYRGNE